MMDKILCFLESGQWHSFQDVKDWCLLSKRKLGLALSFLNQYDFIEVDEKEQKVRLTPRMFTFINRLNVKESELTLTKKEREEIKHLI